MVSFDRLKFGGKIDQVGCKDSRKDNRTIVIPLTVFHPKTYSANINFVPVMIFD